jgi:hypothetical protein
MVFGDSFWRIEVDQYAGVVARNLQHLVGVFSD